MPKKQAARKSRPRAFMNVAEVAKMLRRPPEVIRDLIQNGRLVGQKMGDDWLVARDEVARFDKEEGGGRRDA